MRKPRSHSPSKLASGSTPPPPGLRAGGARLWASVTSAHQLDTAQLATLAAACRQQDLSDRLTIRASDGEVSAERLQRIASTAVSRLLAALRLPDSGEVADRDAFERQVRRVASDCHRDGRLAAMFLVDVDDFTAVNNRVGRAAGDELLAVVAQRVKAALPPRAVVIRYGDDQIAALVEHVTTAAECREVAGQVLASVGRPLPANGSPIHVTASIGISLTDDNHPAETLSARARSAIRRAKRRGRSRVVIEGLSPRSAARPGPEARSESVDVEAVSSGARSVSGESLHAVHFYRDLDDLVPALAGYVTAGLLQHGVLVIATPEHRKLLSQRVDAGILRTAKAEGRFFELDAAETLSQFMRNGMPDRELFEEVVGRIVLRTVAVHGGIRAFGEMVSLLWADGQEAAALALEEHWNDLQRERPFPLLCGYPLGLFDDRRDDGYEQICMRHTELLDG